MQITVSPKQLATELKVCLQKGLVPYVTSSPGMGKSSIVADIATQGNLKLLDLRLSQCTPEDLQGFPMRVGEKAVFTPFDIFPLEGEELPDMLDADGNQMMAPRKDTSEKEVPRKMNGWLLLLDELSSANKAVQAAAYKLLLDRQVGSHNLHENVYMVACGNKITDKAVVHKMSTALQSRLIHYELDTKVIDWVDWAMKRGFDYRITGFINFSPDKLMHFDPNHTDKTYPCPRTWEFVDALINGETVNSDDYLPRIAGTIGQGTAVEFLSFCEIQSSLPAWSNITDPKQAQTLPIPSEASGKYAAICMIAARAEAVEVKNVLEYVQRFTPDFQIIFCRGILSRFPNMDRDDPVFNKYAMTMISSLRKK